MELLIPSEKKGKKDKLRYVRNDVNLPTKVFSANFKNLFSEKKQDY